MAVTRARVVQILPLLALFACSLAVAGSPQEMLGNYFLQLQSSLNKLDDKSVSSKERLKLRSALVNGRGAWIMKHGNPGRAANLVGLFYRKKPSAWSFTPKEIQGTYARLYVDFSMPELTGHPWRTEFDLVPVKGKWQIRSFTDITRRPLPLGSDIKTVLNGYFSAARKAAESLYSGKLGKEEKQAVNMVYGLGAGYWIGQLKRKDLPAGTMFTYFISVRPASWEIEQARIAGAYAEAKVHFASKPRHGAPVRKTYTFELNQDKGEWFIVGHRSKKKKSDSKPLPKPVLATNGTGPEELVKMQLDLLDKKDVKMQDLVKLSEPLWLDTKKARQGMGRLIGMAMGMLRSDKNSPTMEISDTTKNGTTAQVTVRAVWSKAVTIKLFSSIQFTLQQTAAGWRMANAQILRN